MVVNMTMSGIKVYPLYDELVRRVEFRTEKEIDIKRVCMTINSIATTHTPEQTNEHYREIGALILHHELLTKNGVLLSSVAHEGRVMVGGKGVLYNIMNLPPLLQQIIAQYIEDPSLNK
ncbi:MAG: hypothetical protein ABIQ41_02010 [Gemmatimonadales bacterium]